MKYGTFPSVRINPGFENSFQLARKIDEFLVRSFFLVTGISEFRKLKDFRVNWRYTGSAQKSGPRVNFFV